MAGPLLLTDAGWTERRWPRGTRSTRPTRDLTGAGYHGRQSPYDAFWGARYAIVDDPDGYNVGLMSPIDPARKSWPPIPPPGRA